LSITAFLITATSAVDICYQYAATSNTMAGTDGSFESPETESLRVTTIQGFFGTYNGEPGALISLLITA
jgi:hypothetical protein